MTAVIHEVVEKSGVFRQVFRCMLLLSALLPFKGAWILVVE